MTMMRRMEVMKTATLRTMLEWLLLLTPLVLLGLGRPACTYVLYVLFLFSFSFFAFLYSPPLCFAA